MASASRGKPGSSISKALTDQFCAITGATADVAERVLEACSGNLEMAIGMHMDSDGTGLVSDGASNGAPLASSTTTDEVRAPIPQRQEVLVDDSYTFGNFNFRGRRRGARSVFDGFRDFQAEAREQELERAAAGGVVARPISRKQRTLEDLFRPPIDIMFKGSFLGARDEGSAANKWLMVNIQNSREFQCQVLNRDVWSNHAVKGIISAHFVFWQVYNDSEEGRKFMQFYHINDWPYIAILDPRTGESMITWNLVDPLALCDLLTNFLSQHEQPEGCTSSPEEPEEPAAKRQKKDSIVDATEASQLEAAIQASIEEKTVGKRKKPAAVVIDSDDEFCSEDDLETFSDSEDETTQGRTSSNKNNTVSSVDSKTDSSRSTSSDVNKSQEQSGSSNNNCPGTSATCPDRPSVITPTLAIPSTSTSTPSSSSEPSAKTDKNSSSSTKNGTSTNKVPSVPDTEAASESTNKFPAVPCSTESFHVSYKDFLGSEEDPKSILNIWFPDGQRKQLSIPCTSKLEALVLYVQEEGYHQEMYDLVTNYPRRKLSDLDMSDTLKNQRLYPQEKIFVQEK